MVRLYQLWQWHGYHFFLDDQDKVLFYFYVNSIHVLHNLLKIDYANGHKIEVQAIARITDSKNVQKWHYLCISHITLLGIEVLVKYFVFL